MMAYLAMMAPRLVELHRVLKPTGSLYLHCDPTASHYLRIMLDQVFAPTNFLNEIVWKRTGAHNSANGTDQFTMSCCPSLAPPITFGISSTRPKKNMYLKGSHTLMTKAAHFIQ